MDSWVFGCAGWVIADGTYSHIEVGRVLEASIEFWYTSDFSAVDAGVPAARLIKGHTYAITATIAERSDYVVLDLGPLQVSCLAAPYTQFAGLHVGDVVEGRVGLALNAFDWDESAA